MAKVAMLLPFAEMCNTAQELLVKYPNIHTICVEHVQTNEIAARARALDPEDGRVCSSFDLEEIRRQLREHSHCECPWSEPQQQQLWLLRASARAL